MIRIAGFWWIAVSAIHGLVGIFGYFDQWKAIAQAGWFNAVSPNPLAPIFDREDAFFLTVLTPFLFLIGNCASGHTSSTWYCQLQWELC